MTSKELKRLRRTDLMEMLLELSKENVMLRQQLEEANARLEEKELRVEQAGSLAEAALQLNGIFAAAQAACEQYEHNIRLRCQELEEQTRRECAAIREEARAKAQAKPPASAPAPAKGKGKRRGKR